VLNLAAKSLFGRFNAQLSKQCLVDQEQRRIDSGVVEIHTAVRMWPGNSTGLTVPIDLTAGGDQGVRFRQNRGTLLPVQS